MKIWSLEPQSEVIIHENGGQVNDITMYEDTFFAGMEDGTILSWKSTFETSFCEEPTSLKGHTGSDMGQLFCKALVSKHDNKNSLTRPKTSFLYDLLALSSLNYVAVSYGICWIRRK
ncbi:hypothetical protein Tco_0111237 [Tanacetum coccineum]